MIKHIKKKLASGHLKSNLLLIITAAALLEMISGVQYYYSHSLLEEELEKQAETELTLKSIIAGSSRNTVESALLSHIRDINHDMANPDAMYSATEWLVKYSKTLAGGGIAFIPDYYPQKGRLFEPYSYWKDGEIVTTEISEPGHDYTESAIFRRVVESDSSYWSKRYHDTLATGKDLICYCLPIHDNEEKTIAVLYMDIDTEWLGDTLNSRNLFPSSFDMLLTREGDLIAGPRESRVSKTTINHVISLINDSTVEKRYSAKGRCRIVKFRNPDNGEKGQLFISIMQEHHQWQVVVACYDKEVFGDLRRMRLIILLLMAAAFIILLGIIKRVANNDKRLQQTEMEKKRIDGELLVANKIQQSMLPHHHHQQEYVELYGSLVPAREVGGDLYDYFIRDEKLFFCIGDVSGKGVPSAMLMAVIHSRFRAFTAHENNPARIMQAINEASCQGNDSNMFVTLFIGVLDLPTGQLRYCNAGHDAPIVTTFSSSGENTTAFLPVLAHLPVGVFDDVKYTMQETSFATTQSTEANAKTGALIFLYTDGLTEAMNKEHKQFGTKRMEAVLGTCPDMQPKNILETVSEAVRQFTTGAEQSDDLTMLAIHYIPHQFKCTLTEELVIKNDIHEVTRFSCFMKAVTEKLDIEKSLARQLRLAVEEAVVNAIDYAYPPDKEGDIIIKTMSDGHSFRCQIIDSGIPFDPTAKEKTDITLSAEDRQLGGLGILLVRELMDSINYERINGQNILTLIKNKLTP